MRYSNSNYHQPVLLNEVLDFWHCKKGGFYIDGTLGTGGHAQALLENDLQATCLGIDCDPDAIAIAEKRLERFKNRFQIVKENYMNIPKILDELKFPKVDGLLLDLGVSSLQLSSAERGFSFLHSGPLDMRMDPTGGETAIGLIHRFSVEQLAQIIFRYGEERFARIIASVIKKAELKGDINNTLQLANIISHAVLGKRNGTMGRIHPATKTFQALRIAVNKELENLEFLLNRLEDILTSGGRAVFIAFHSLEDRLIKIKLKELARGCVCPNDFPKCVCGKKPIFRILTRKVIKPTLKEIEQNPRSRSARIRVVEKV